jgi:hypothetical protein
VTPGVAGSTNLHPGGDFRSQSVLRAVVGLPYPKNEEVAFRSDGLLVLSASQRQREFGGLLLPRTAAYLSLDHTCRHLSWAGSSACSLPFVV